MASENIMQRHQSYSTKQSPEICFHAYVYACQIECYGWDILIPKGNDMNKCNQEPMLRPNDIFIVLYLVDYSVR